MQNFSEWFTLVTQKPDQASRPPFPYQERLATAAALPIFLNVPTGAGKTAAVVLSWLWRRRYDDAAKREQTPRRLVYCLPMRTLVEQTDVEVRQWVERAAMLAQEAEADRVAVHVLMGGAVSDRWEAHPEKDCILIGTQDQLLSRALNRGYGMSRYKWSIHFALLNNDCLWVMDEVQLMGAGLRTTAQLQGFRGKFGTYGTTRSLWMSATLDPEQLQTVNYQPDYSQTHALTAADLQSATLQKRMQASKQLLQSPIACAGKEKDYAKELAKAVVAVHQPGTLTLIICNRVSRAQELYKALQKQTNEALLLIHSRFRAEERQRLNQKLRQSELAGILVATQAIEAGVDLSARMMFTELAPWSSLVQRFGRCNRYGEYASESTIYWIDVPDLKKDASPYQPEPLETARLLLKDLSDVGPEVLKLVSAPKEALEGLIPRQHDLLQLFDTSTDLAGHDIDISAFIRETDETDVAIAWRDWTDGKPPEAMGALQQRELCRVSIRRARAFLDHLKKQARTAWVWDGLSGEWVKAKSIYPGMSLLLPCSDGGYSDVLGFTGDVGNKPDVIPQESIELDQDAADPLTYRMNQYITLSQHSQDVAAAVQQLCSALADYDLADPKLLAKAGRWHDLGKAHTAFQEMLTRDRPDRQEGGPWAKSDQSTRMRLRQHFRHELVSALVALQEGEPFLLCYLVAAHHGKVRMTIQARPNEKAPGSIQRFALGVWEGDCLPPVDLGDGVISRKQELSLACIELGGDEHGESWTAQAIALLETHGPFKLAFLETLIRVADWRGSTKYATDLLGRLE